MSQLATSHIESTRVPYTDRVCHICERGRFVFLLSNTDRLYFDRSIRFDLYRCNNCGYVELDCERDFETIASFYPSGDYYSYQDQSKYIGLKSSLFNLFFKRLSPLASILRDVFFFPVKQGVRSIEIVPGGRLFDIGCGSGKFLRIAKALGMKPYGLDIDPKALESAKEVTADITCEVTEEFQGFFVGQDRIEFEVITSNHVIEHSTDPAKFLRSAASSLKADGVMIIGTPNIASPIAKLFGRFWVGLDTPRHLCLFTPSNFSLLCQQEGLRVDKVRHNFNGYSIVLSSLFIVENLRGKKFSNLFRSRSILLGKIFLFPLCMLVNILQLSDSVDYYISKSA